MKRTPITRRTPLSRQPLKRRPKGKSRAAKDVLSAYASSHLRCGLCGIRADRAFDVDRMLEVHHLAGRGRFHDVEGNLLMLCRRDHRQFHTGGCFGDDGERLPELTPGHMLWAKEQSDGVDLGLIASLKGWRGLPAKWEPCALPGAYLIERENNL